MERDGPLNRLTGQGWVGESTDHDYAHALSLGTPVTLLVAETTGAVSAAFDTLLRHLGRLARSKGTVDHTGYGTARSSPRDFYRHHLSAHSAAVVFADVTAPSSTWRRTRASG